MQCRERGIEPGPLASFNRWRELGRYVKKGEKALSLFMPITIKCREWDERRRAAGTTDDGENGAAGQRTIFILKRNWFVLSQTEGRPYEPEPTPGWDRDAALAALDIEMEPFTMTDGNCQGYATKGRKIAVSPLAPYPHKTLFHEVAHVVLGHVSESAMTDGERTPQSLREVEAEAVALICCESLGLPGSDEARGYIQHWLDGEVIPEKSARSVFHAADRILCSCAERREDKDRLPPLTVFDGHSLPRVSGTLTQKTKP